MNAPVDSAMLAKVSLDDKYTLEKGRVFLTGTQALIRLLLLQRERDQRAGLNTAGFVSGYRGSPLGGLDQALWRAQKHLEAHHVKFQPGVNEDLAATAIWGTQQVGMFPGAKYDGVFGMWYGKGPGVDRCGDVFKHANSAGTSKNGGVLVLAGDDHAAKSSTLAHQSEHILKACCIPVLNPANVQDYLDFGLHGYRDEPLLGPVDRFQVRHRRGRVGRLGDRRSRARTGETAALTSPCRRAGSTSAGPTASSSRKRACSTGRSTRRSPTCAPTASTASSGIRPARKLGIITTGKSFGDTMQALADLGIDENVARDIGLRVYKVAMSWPLEPQGARRFAQGLEEILVVEEKRQLIEYQIKEELYTWEEGKRSPRVVGKFDDNGEWSRAEGQPAGTWLLPANYEHNPGHRGHGRSPSG